MKKKAPSTEYLRDPVEFTVYVEPASKANSRKAVRFGNRSAFIKSDKARAVAKIFREQCPQLAEPFEDDVMVEIVIFYASRRPDLDESLILDLMQFDPKTGINYIYRNDRLVKKKVIHWGLDPENPRIHIRVSPYVVPAWLTAAADKKKHRA